jgi:hypothetical protein
MSRGTHRQRKSRPSAGMRCLNKRSVIEVTYTLFLFSPVFALKTSPVHLSPSPFQKWHSSLARSRRGPSLGRTTIHRERGSSVRAMKSHTADRNFVQRLYSRFAFLAFLAFLALLEISNLRVLNISPGSLSPIMELQILDPFGDYETRGYLRNTYQEKDIRLVGHLETAAFEQEIISTVRFLRRLPALRYEHLTETHYKRFSSLYPWAGQDCSITAPDIAIVKAGYKTLFAHPAMSDGQRSTPSIWGETRATYARIRARSLDTWRMPTPSLKGTGEPSSPFSRT